MRFLYIAVVSGILIWPSNTLGQDVEIYTLGNWKISAKFNKETGLFSSCVGMTDSGGGLVLITLVSRNWFWDIGFYSKHWNHSRKKKIRVRYKFDQGKWHNATAKAVSPHVLQVQMDGQDSSFSSFRRAANLKLFDGNRHYTFSLRGSSKAMAELMRCTERYVALEELEKRMGRSGEGEVAGRSGATPGTQDQPAGLSRAGRPEDRPVKNTQELRAESMRILFNFLSDLGLQGARILSPSELPEEFEVVDAIAQADEFTGVVHTLPGRTIYRSRAVISRLISVFARRCAEKFASDTSADSMEGVDVYSSYAICRTKDEIMVKQYLVAPREDGGAYMIILSTAHSFDPLAPTDPEYVEPEISREDFRRAAFLASRSVAERIELRDNGIPHLAR